MACNITKGLAVLDCKDSVSGLKAIYLSNYNDFTYTVGVGTTASPGLAQTITALSTSNSGVFYKYELKNSTNTFNQDIKSNRDNGTTTFTQTLNFVVNKLQSELEFQIKMMAYGRPQIIVEANNGTFFLIGKNLGCEISGKSDLMGTMDAMNGYHMIAVATEKDPIFYLSTTASTALLAAIASANI